MPLADPRTLLEYPCFPDVLLQGDLRHLARAPRDNQGTTVDEFAKLQKFVVHPDRGRFMRASCELHVRFTLDRAVEPVEGQIRAAGRGQADSDIVSAACRRKVD